jgi:hypothetical protein
MSDRSHTSPHNLRPPRYQEAETGLTPITGSPLTVREVPRIGNKKHKVRISPRSGRTGLPLRMLRHWQVGKVTKAPEGMPEFSGRGLPGHWHLPQ